MHAVWLLSLGKIDLQFEIKSTVQRVLSNIDFLVLTFTINPLLSASVRAIRDMFILLFFIMVIFYIKL